MVLFFVSMAFCSLLMGPDFNPFEGVHQTLYQITKIPVAPATEERLKLRKQEAATTTTSAAAHSTGAVNGGNYKKPFHKISRAVELTKVLVPVLAILLSLYNINSPRTAKLRLSVDERLYPGEYIAACGFRDRGCQQHYLTIDSHDGQLALFRGTSPKDPESVKVWGSKFKRRIGQLLPTG